MSLRMRLIMVGAVVLWLGFMAGINYVPVEQRTEAWYLPDEGLRLGLDLRGGMHWVLGVKLEEAIEQELNTLARNFKDEFEEDKIATNKVERDGTEILFEASRSNDLPKIREAVDDSGYLDLVEETAPLLRYKLNRDWEQEVRERGMLQALEVLRGRIDDPQTGIPESVVTRQGKDRILVQIPGGDIERGRARELLRTTGFLEFKIVEGAADTEELLSGSYPDGLPEGKEILVQRNPDSHAVVAAFLLPKDPAITGENLDDARVGFDNRGRSLVNFTWNSEGAKKFGDISGSNIGERLAIILDNQVYSAPVIQSRISVRGQITGDFTPDEAKDLAVILRAGSLSVPVVIEEERTIGPALGKDSIDRGLRASAMGLTFVVIFALIYYRLSGGYASLALFLNLVMVIGIMSMFRATLTLPGIAGLVLTVGMAIDANVIIFERIREELRAGKLPRAAISTGFTKATWTILDANITTLITALVLFQYGTGPIKGFAVTLAIGILTSVFAAMVITRLLFALYPGHRTVQALSI